MDQKAFKKLVTLCRKLGIQHYKCGDLEFTLGATVEYKTKTVKRPISKNLHLRDITTDEEIDSTDENIPTDGIDSESLLFWSSDPSEKIDV